MTVPNDEDIRGQLVAQQYLEAFEILVERYQHKVFRLSYSILGDEASAEEMAQDVFLRIWKALPSFRGEASLSTWIYTITRNRCLTGRKKWQAQATRSLEEPAIRRQAEMKGLKPKEEIDTAGLLARLSAPYRQALELFYMEEKSYQEVAAMLGLPLGTVKTYLHRARKQLAGMLEKSSV